MKKSPEIKWLAEPVAKDYPAAESYLQLVFDAKKALRLVKKLKRASMTRFAAKDILRASGLPMAEMQAFDWKSQNDELKKHDPLSPLLLVRPGKGRHLIIADGFHRLCAVFALDQKAEVPCKIV